MVLFKTNVRLMSFETYVFYVCIKYSIYVNKIMYSDTVDTDTCGCLYNEEFERKNSDPFSSQNQTKRGLMAEVLLL